MTPYWFDASAAIGVVVALVGCLGIVVSRALHRRPRLVVEDNTRDDLMNLYDALQEGLYITSGPYAGLHEGCANAWIRTEYAGMCQTCRTATSADSEVTQ